MTPRVLLGVLGFTTVTACEVDEEQLRARAAFDMQCRQEDLRVIYIDDRTRGVRGCGKQLTYVCAGPNEADCTWVLNTDSQRMAR
jgi:hypothetical protein